MKAIIVIIVMTVIALNLNAQNSKSLLKERNKEIKEVKEVGYNPATEAEKIESINAFYAPLIERAMEAETKEEKPANTTTDNTTKKRNSFGADVVYQGDQGDFSGRSVSIKNGAEAYATVSMADANAYLVRSMADGSTAKMSAPDLSVGLEGTIINKYRYQELSVKIVGVNPGNTYNKTFLLGKEQSITDYLLPGTYRAYIKGLNNSQASAQEFIVTADKIHSVNGKNVYWGIWGGTSW